MTGYSEPWRYVMQEGDDTLVMDADGIVRARCGGTLRYTDDLVDAARIAACVNACADISDEQLAGGVVTLADVLRALGGMIPHPYGISDEWMGGYRAALRQAKQALAEQFGKEANR